MKIRLFNSNVQSVLLYGSECWQVVKEDMDMIHAFYNGEENLPPLTVHQNINWRSCTAELVATVRSTETKHWQLRWLGHPLSMDQDRTPKAALIWTPPGKRKPGQPKERLTQDSWRRAERNETCMRWGSENGESERWMTLDHQSLISPVGRRGRSKVWTKNVIY